MEFLKKIFGIEDNYYQRINKRLHSIGKVFVPKNVIGNSEIFNSGYIYEMELIDGYMEITAHKKIDLEPLVPDNIIEMPRVLY